MRLKGISMELVSFPTVNQWRLKKALGTLYQLDEDRCYSVGGYPATFSTEIPGYIIIASEGYQSPELTVFTEDALVRQYVHARYLRFINRPEMSMRDAWYEAECDIATANRDGEAWP